MLVLASASPRRRELLTQAGFTFEIHPAHIPEDPNPGEEPIAYVTRLAREKAQAVYSELTQPARQSDSSPVLKGHDFSRVSMGLRRTQVDENALECPLKPNDLASVFDRAETDSKEGRALAPEGSIPESHTTQGAPEPALSLSKGLASDIRDTTNLDPKDDTKNETSESLIVLGADTTVTLENHILGKPEDPADAARMLRLLSGRTHRVITGIAVVTATRIEVAAEVTAVRFLTLSEQEIAAYIATDEPMDKAGAYAIQGLAARWIPRIEGCYFNVVGLPIALVSALLESCSVFARTVTSLPR